MEGKKSIKHISSVITLVILHAVGLAGFMHDDWHAQFVELVPVHLTVITVILLLNHNNYNKQFFLFITSSFFLGFLAEWIGTSTGALFGKYHYNSNLGPSLFNVPLLIGVLWAGLAYAANSISRRIKGKGPAFYIVIASILMTSFDLLLEPFAVSNGLWVWDEGKIPITNYNTWFGLSAVLGIIYHYTIVKDGNHVSIWYYALQVIFFLVLLIAGLG